MEGKFTRARSNLDPDPASKVPETISRTAGQGSGLLNKTIQTADLRQSVESAFLISQAQSEQDQYCEADYAPPLKQKSYRFSDSTENPLQLKSQVFAIGEDGGLITE